MINKATLLGRIGKKDIKDIKTGGFMVNLYMATTKKYKDSTGEPHEVTTWHNVNFFHRLADIVKAYAHVGNLVYIEGEINNKKLEYGVNAGQYHYSITGSEIKFISASKKNGDETISAEAVKPSTIDNDALKQPDKNKKFIDDYGDIDDNLPF